MAKKEKDKLMSAKIASAIHAVMQDVPYVQKTGKNEFHRYRYASEADLLDKLRPALIKHGLILIPSAQEASPADQYGNVTIRVEYTLIHKDGDVWPEKIGAIGCGNDRSKDGKVGDKGVYKALTGANKYLLFKLFQIETGDDPEQDAIHEQQPTEKPQQKPQPVLSAEHNQIMRQPPTALQELAQPGVAEGIAPASQSKEVYMSNSIALINRQESAPQLLEWAKKERKMVWPQYGIDPHDEDGQRLVTAYRERMALLEKERMAVLEQAGKTEAVE
jgi:hypothetical protein